MSAPPLSIEQLGQEVFPGLSGKRVLLTGHTGFVGSWLAIWLNALEAKVFGYSLPPPTTPSNYQRSGVSELLADECLGDICDEQKLSAFYTAVRPEIVFHLAAQPIVRLGYEEPRQTLQSNVIGTAAVLDCARALTEPAVIVMMTSDKCYHNPETGVGLVESDRMGGKDPYSASKGAAELVLAAYRESFFPPKNLARHGVHVAAVRAGNIIGGGDWADSRIVPDIVRALESGRVVEVRQPDSVRPWQHVCEPIFGMLKLATTMLGNEDPLWSDAWNFGPPLEERVRVRELCDCFLQNWGSGRWEQPPSAAETMKEARYLQLNSEKAAKHLEWLCRFSTAEAIQLTAEWYARNGRGENARDLCRENIRHYLSKN